MEGPSVTEAMERTHRSKYRSRCAIAQADLKGLRELGLRGSDATRVHKRALAELPDAVDESVLAASKRSERRLKQILMKAASNWDTETVNDENASRPKPKVEPPCGPAAVGPRRAAATIRVVWMVTAGENGRFSYHVSFFKVEAHLDEGTTPAFSRASATRSTGCPKLVDLDLAPAATGEVVVAAHGHHRPRTRG